MMENMSHQQIEQMQKMPMGKGNAPQQMPPNVPMDNPGHAH